MQLIRHQISFFIPNAFYGNLQGVLKYFIDKAGNVLDAEPTILPIPENAPQEIPKFIMRSRDGMQDLQLKVNRIDTSLVRPFDVGISDRDREGFEKDVMTWILPFINDNRVYVNRVAVVFQRALEPEGKTPGEYISQKYCKKEFLEQPFRNAKNFEIHCLKQYEFLGYPINSWARIQVLDVLPTQKKVVGILNDLNHMPLDRALTTHEIENFIISANSESIKILGFYKLVQ